MTFVRQEPDKVTVGYYFSCPQIYWWQKYLAFPQTTWLHSLHMCFLVWITSKPDYPNTYIAFCCKWPFFKL